MSCEEMRFFVFHHNFSVVIMKNLLVLLLISLLLYSCNDGDIIVTSFDFEDVNLQTCKGAESYVFFKINSAATESISLRISTTEELFLESSTITVSLNGTSNVVNYRNYDSEITSAYFCSAIPPVEPSVAADYIGASGTAILVTETVLNDNDGLEEDIMSNLDTDMDGLLNFFDLDDDGDNVPTALELGEDPLNPRDSDGDGIKDYLDADDDNDGVPTRYEAGGDLDPITNVTDQTVGPDYLNPAVNTEVIIDEYRTHTYQLSSDIRLSFSGLVLTNGEEEITQESLDLGEQQNVEDRVITITPIVN
jgi:hypothetical protein